MTTPVLILLAIGLLMTAHIGYAVWGIAHDVYDHGPVPKLEFIWFCPMPIAFSISQMLKTHGSLPSPWIGFGIYLVLAAAFGWLHACFERIGKPERQRQLEIIRQEQQAAPPESTVDPATDTTAPDPAQKPRERFFFWLGVLVLPLFWSWFTLGRAFTRSQRVAAFSWLASTTCWAVWRWQSLAEHWTLLTIGYPIVSGFVTFSLLAWLFYRLGLRPSTLLEVVFPVFVIGPHLIHFMAPFYFAVGAPFTAFWLLPPLVVALLHLMLEPVNRWARGSGTLRGC